MHTQSLNFYLLRALDCSFHDVGASFVSMTISRANINHINSSHAQACEHQMIKDT